jgi:hypothetical protein
LLSSCLQPSLVGSWQGARHFQRRPVRVEPHRRKDWLSHTDGRNQSQRQRHPDLLMADERYKAQTSRNQINFSFFISDWRVEFGGGGHH